MQPVQTTVFPRSVSMSRTLLHPCHNPPRFPSCHKPMPMAAGNLIVGPRQFRVYNKKPSPHMTAQKPIPVELSNDFNCVVITPATNVRTYCRLRNRTVQHVATNDAKIVQE